MHTGGRPLAPVPANHLAHPPYTRAHNNTHAHMQAHTRTHVHTRVHTTHTKEPCCASLPHRLPWTTGWTQRWGADPAAAASWAAPLPRAWRRCWPSTPPALRRCGTRCVCVLGVKRCGLGAWCMRVWCDAVGVSWCTAVGVLCDALSLKWEVLIYNVVRGKQRVGAWWVESRGWARGGW